MEINVTPRRVDDVDTSDVPTNDKPIWMFGLLILLGGLGAFTVWASVAPIDGAAVAPGTIAVESSRKTIQHWEGGIVREILVREGDEVQYGDVLVRLDDTEASSQLEIVRSQYRALRAREARLLAERDGLDEIEFSESLQGNIEDPRVREAIVGEQRVFKTRRDALEGEKAVLGQRIEQLEQQILGLEAQVASRDRRIELFNEEIKGLEDLFKRGMGDKSRLREWERQVADLEGERSDQLSTIAATRVRISETELQILQLSHHRQSEVSTELREVETRLEDLVERQRALKNTLRRTEITAPVSGSVVSMNLHTIGGVIRPGDPIMNIIPADEELIIEAQVRPMDIDRVHAGLQADLRMSAFNARTTPKIPGSVITVSADILNDPKTGMPYYLARVRVTAEGIELLEGRNLQPGMPVEVMIITGERTFFDYLLRPLTDMFARAFRED